MTPADYKATREKLGLTQAGLAARLLGSEARRTTIVKREAGLQEITEEMALALRALTARKPRTPRPRSNPREGGNQTPFCQDINVDAASS